MGNAEGSGRRNSSPFRLLAAIWPAILGWVAVVAMLRADGVHPVRPEVWQLVFKWSMTVVLFAPLAALALIGFRRDAREPVPLLLNASTLLLYGLVVLT